MNNIEFLHDLTYGAFDVKQNDELFIYNSLVTFVSLCLITEKVVLLLGKIKKI